ncbi:bifunctional tetrahydrofolate synthase/dihydrofolate synthase [Alteromonas sediminis]|uniref:Dihydrofolate synthase/folylpolyglutamate synthase n=1 Tax=Alteromonas sediminis TaxID=2259342 RepID=A0A3N5XXE9_9ALTE|nr:bifunctional tetrahydrofolate synthase/dihydrofolate synthase [Alteromonas sediminis]RPJ65113.1 bifunctional tetrahydrofolate synthase/dihydrofolate synthase [Alteromonas sediminis]
MRSLQQWLSYLESIHPTSIDMGLVRVKRVADRLDFNWHSSTVITVGGTNGKGTTCRVLEYLLQAQGHSVATYRSPHLLDYRERVTFNGEMRDESEYTQAMQDVEEARGAITLTYFEFGTLAAMQMMQQWKPDFILLEVGLGGRLDATNIVDNDCAVITSIGIDHERFLGNTRESVATEKAGIFRAHKPVIIGETSPPAPLLEKSCELRSLARWAGKDFAYHENTDGSWSWSGKQNEFDNLPYPQVPIQNMSTALATLEALGLALETKHINACCREARLPGRRQIIQRHPTVLVDVAHNPHAAADLVKYLTTHSSAKHYRLVVAMLNDKATKETLACFECLAASWYLSSTSGERGLPAQALKETLNTICAATCYENIEQAYLSALKEADRDDIIVVFGSFLTVADVLALGSE